MRQSKSRPILHTELAGKDWLYHGNHYHVTKVEANGTKIITDKRTFTFLSEVERDYFLAELTPSESLPAAERPKTNQQHGLIIKADKESDDIFTQMLGELKADFDKMKDDPEYVKIAKQRANQVNTMTNLVKTKIQLERLNRS